MGRRQNKGRRVNGILLLDKPLGLTSNDALQRVKWLYRAQKAGHTGSLDPLADGLLPLCFGNATKMSAYLLDADKRYWTTVRLGETTVTADAEGEVVERREVGDLDRARIEAVLAEFKGEISQLPPMYSALKHKGERLYNLARKGIEVEREPRTVYIHELNLVSVELPEIVIDVHCSKGTYIRTLAEDIGKRLGCGGHVRSLRRTGVGPYGAEGMISMEQVEEASQNGPDALDALLLPLESAVGAWPAVQLTADSAFYVRSGQPVLVPRAPTEGWVRIYDELNSFMGVGEILDDGKVAPRRLMK
ncbi:MAG: tRNA pseudouridine(55) synthase TruB [Gammaproteobacteria bacterium]|nr:tRNA pseudouridine(55) synthase TruB [Gammaproteobacteria bacterium]MBU1655463.1 tRNA pseudouridine(55) synthase TruB [Gammaproteobacteria bacterium]MBU1962430.1 tRNA pseudouridine(55) synthase TruB [Gammaproteobacteria bacterium]